MVKGWSNLEWFENENSKIYSFEEWCKLNNYNINNIQLNTQKTMAKQREFKIGDKCVVEYTVTEIFEKDEYPIHCRDVNGKLRTFSREGIVYLNGRNTPILKYIEDINQNSEYPKWMMVSNHITSATVKRFVIGTILNKYVALNDSVSENSINYKKYVENPNDNSIHLTVWDYAEEIEGKSSTIVKEILVNKADELMKMAQELIKESNRL